MKNALLICTLSLLCAASASAQTGMRYRFDNFDTSEGVRVEQPAPPRVSKPSKISKPSRNVQLSARSVVAGQPANTQSAEIVYTRTRSMAMMVGHSLDGFSTGDTNIDSFIVESGTRNGVDPVLLYSIMHRESSFKKSAVSYKGARGLMQLMPGTAARFGVRNIFDPRQNIEGGTRYMRFLLDMFDGDVGLALAGYNAGEGAVLKYGRRVPPYSETQEYVRRIWQRYALMRDPQTARRAPVLSRTQVATIKSMEKSEAISLYEQSVHAVRMPDGKLRLVSQ
ncbi:MAG: lytic transglycosylase domain-containing protein [Acidobacteria bacterium]|nr:lytic transglycosylase domain-containing protein [Acidobacteriota bacterium]